MYDRLDQSENQGVEEGINLMITSNNPFLPAAAVTLDQICISYKSKSHTDYEWEIGLLLHSRPKKKVSSLEDSLGEHFLVFPCSIGLADGKSHHFSKN